MKYYIGKYVPYLYKAYGRKYGEVFVYRDKWIQCIGERDDFRLTPIKSNKLIEVLFD